MNNADDKVVFRKEDVVRLDRMPSHLAADAQILRTPRRGLLRRLFSVFVILFVLLAIAAGTLYAALSMGFLDQTLTARAGIMLNQAVGPGLEAKIGSTRIRLSSSSVLALEATGVELHDKASGRRLLNADSVSMGLDPVQLVQGHLRVSDVRIGHARLDASLFATGKPVDWSKLRIDTMADWQGRLHQAAAKAAERLVLSPAASVQLQDLTIDLPVVVGTVQTVVIADTRLEFSTATEMRAAGVIRLSDKTTRFDIRAAISEARVPTLSVALSDIPLGLLAVKMSKFGPNILHGVDAPASVRLVSQAGEADGSGRSLTMNIAIGAGTAYADKLPQTVTSGDFKLSYDYVKRMINIDSGLAVLGPSRVPVEGAVVDMDRIEGWTGPGYAAEIVSNDGVMAAEDSGEAPLSFSAKASLFYEVDKKKLSLGTGTISTPLGNAALSLALTYGHGSPEISFTLRSSEIASAMVKQFWPYWIAQPARKWVFANLFAGVVSNGEADVFIPAGVLEEGKVTPLNDKQLSVRFDIANTRFNFLGDLPPVRNASGHFEQVGGRIAVTVKTGDIFLPSDKSVRISDASLVVDDAFTKPLMADIALKAAGDAATVAELSKFNPIAALQKTDFVASDFSGPVTGNIKARIGLVANQNPPKPVWTVAMALDGVSLKKKISGRTLEALNGTLSINQTGIELASKAEIDGAKFDIDLKQRLDDPKGTARKLKLSGTLEGDAIGKFAPSLADIIGGRIAVKLQADPSGRQDFDIDLGRASLSIPWIGWKKGVGVPARAVFSAMLKDGVTRIDDFELTGDGFGAKGQVTTDKNGLVTASFGRVRLTPADNYQMSIKRVSGGLAVDVKGKVADLRPIVGSLRGSTAADRNNARALVVSLALDKVIGYNQETFEQVKFKIATAKGRINTLALTAVTKSGQALVATKSADGTIIEITAGDAGAVARFADVYRNMTGGLLNIKLRAKDGDSWRGSVDVRAFALINEARLKSLVSAKSDKDGRSLNDAVKQQIDASSQKFRRGFARVLVDGPVIRVENGIVRGDELGAVFQGTVRDGKNRMDMTGTFMPAYGLNRLFSELPIIGALLGNGTDRGLLGITFKLEGPVDNPKLSVNPLSLIAPGVFRNIFEFE